MKKTLLLFLFLFSRLIQAQWVQLHAVISPFNASNPAYYCSLGIIMPQVIAPVGDGRIVYTTYCGMSPSSGGKFYVQYSSSDLSSMQIRANYIGFACCSSSHFVSAGDSTFAYVLGGGSTYVEFTKNNYVSSSYGGFNIPGYPAKSVAISPNYVYGLLQAYLNDSMRIYRSSRAGFSVTRRSGFLYDAVPDRLEFINDSTGFTIADFKSNSGKTTLLKTVDYGASWIPVLVDSIDPIVDYHAVSATRIYACRQSGAVSTSTNAGLSWTLQGSAPASSYTTLRFCNDTIGYIGGNNGMLFKTTDFGVTWTPETSNTTLQIQKLFTFGKVAYFRDSNLGLHKNGPFTAGPLIYSFFSPLSSSSVDISCAAHYASSSYTVGSNNGPPYKFSIQSPTCTTSYTTSTTLTNPTFTFNCPGVYTISATDISNVQLGTQTVSITKSYDYTTTITSSKDTVCSGASVVLTFPTSTPDYTITSFGWASGENYVPLTVTPTVTTTYSLSYGAMNNGSYGCNVWGSKTIIVSACAGINEAEKNESFRIYPNPTASTLYISAPSLEITQARIEISNLLGQVLLKGPFKTEISLGDLPKGYYILKIVYNGGELHHNFIKE